MSNIPTPHIEVEDKDLIAKTVLMPGDPLRAEYIANTYLENPVKFNNVRNMYGYTGTYKGKKISVMGSGMGMPSIGIYSYELFSFYDVENIIRIGSAGAYTDKLKLYDIVLAKEAYSESSFAEIVLGGKKDILKASEKLNENIKKAAKENNINIKEETIHSSDVFYRKNFEDYKTIRDLQGCVCVEMESFALFANAKALNKNASCIVTISDNLVTGELTTSQERQEAFNQMMELALNTEY